MINIDELIRNATLSKNKVALNAYKNLKAEIQKFKTAKNAKPYDEASELGIISKYAKSLEDAISQFSEARRDDLALEYTSELEIVKKLLPEPADESQVHFELRKWCVKNNFGNWVELPNYDEIENLLTLTAKVNFNEGSKVIPKKEMGTAIKYLKSKFPTADGKMISEIVKKYVV